jgi:hypothetical protein
MDLLSHIDSKPSPSLLEHLSLRLHRPVFGADRSLFNAAVDPDEMRAACNRLLVAGLRLPDDLEAFVACFTDDVRYVTATGDLWDGKKALRANMQRGLQIVPFMRYGPVDYYHIAGNRLTIYTWNHFGNLGFPNLSVFYYAGGGKFFLAEDFFDHSEAASVVRRYVWAQGSVWNFVKFIVKALFY